MVFSMASVSRGKTDLAVIERDRFKCQCGGYTTAITAKRIPHLRLVHDQKT